MNPLEPVYAIVGFRDGRDDDLGEADVLALAEQTLAYMSTDAQDLRAVWHDAGSADWPDDHPFADHGYIVHAMARRP